MINPWKQGRVPAVPIYPPLGAWQNRRTLASPAWVPEQWARLGIAGAHLFFYQFPALVLNPAETQLTTVTISEDFWMAAILGDATSTGGGEAPAASGSFRALIYEDVNAYKWSKYAVDQANLCSLGTEPGLLKVPHFIAAGTPVNLRAQNLDPTNPNTVTIALFGYSAWWRT